jgi:NDP-sugar pyrophosphorylase family protein
MQAVILAGGLGTRLRPVTQEIPKPMVRVNGVPYLEHQLRLLAKQGIRSVVLLTGYLGDQIEEYFGDGQRLGMKISYSREETPLGTGGALRMARALLHERFLLIYGDSLLPMNYETVLDRLTQSGATGLVVVYDNRYGDTSVANNIALDRNGFVARYEKRVPADPSLTHVEAGVLAFRREVVDLIPEGVVSLEQQVFPALIARSALIGLETRERFYDIGTPERLRVIEQFLSA